MVVCADAQWAGLIELTHATRGGIECRYEYELFLNINPEVMTLVHAAATVSVGGDAAAPLGFLFFIRVLLFDVYFTFFFLSFPCSNI